jgi:Tfp pilus assembly protein PilO
MPFWMGHARPVVALKLIPLWVRLAVLCVSSGIVSIAFFIFLLSPLLQKYTHEKRFALELAQQKEVCVKKLAVFVSAKADSEKQQGHAATSQLPVSTVSFHETVDFILASLHKNNVQCKAIQPLAEKKDSFFTKHYCKVNVKGSFHDIMHFLDDLKQSDHIVKFKSIRFDRWKDQGVRLQAVIRLINLYEAK